MLIGIVRNNIKMAQHRDEPEMQEDMLYRLAKGYQDTPDLRIAILESLSQHHVKVFPQNFMPLTECVASMLCRSWILQTSLRSTCR